MKICAVGADFYSDGRTEGQTDRQDEANICVPKFRESA